MATSCFLGEWPKMGIAINIQKTLLTTLVRLSAIINHSQEEGYLSLSDNVMLREETESSFGSILSNLRPQNFYWAIGFLEQILSWN